MVKAVKNGHNVYMYTLTRGEASGDPHRRTNELINSAKVIGAKKLWIDNFPDTHLSVSSDLINHIERIILKTGADLVLTHSMCDIHHDHRASTYGDSRGGKICFKHPFLRDSTD